MKNKRECHYIHISIYIHLVYIFINVARQNVTRSWTPIAAMGHWIYSRLFIQIIYMTELSKLKSRCQRLRKKSTDGERIEICKMGPNISMKRRQICEITSHYVSWSKIKNACCISIKTNANRLYLTDIT